MNRTFKFSFIRLIVALSVTFCGIATSAMADYTTSFADGDGFTEGGNLNGVDGWSAQSVSGSAVRTFDVDTSGEIRFDANFLRGIVDPTTLAFNVGDTLELTASVKSITGATPGFDANILQMGLTQNTNLGTTSNEAGVLLGASNTGGVFRLASQSNTGRTDSIAIDDSFHTLTTNITKSATTDMFDVVSNFAGTEITYSVTDSALYNAAEVYAIIFSQGQSNVGGVAIDSLSVSHVTAVPEPNALVLFGIGAVGAVGCTRRRRTHASHAK